MGTNGKMEKDPTFRHQNDLVLNVPSAYCVSWVRSYNGIIECICVLPSEPAALCRGESGVEQTG